MSVYLPTSKTRTLPILAFFDIIFAVVAPILALIFRSPELLQAKVSIWQWGPIAEFVALATGCSIFSVMVFRLSENLTEYFSERDLWSIGAASAVSSSLSAALGFVADRLEDIPRSTPLILALVLFAGFSSGRLATVSLVSRRSRSEGKKEGAAMRRVLIVGIDGFSSQAIKLLNAQSPRTLQVVAALDGRPKWQGRSIHGVKFAGGFEDLAAVVHEYSVHGVSVDEVWISDSALARENVDKIVRRQCEMLDLPCLPIATALNLAPKALHRETAHEPNARAKTGSTPGSRVKRTFDVALALALLAALAPVWIVVAACVIYDVGAPVIFWQERIGRNGRRFCLYKFRTYRAPFDANGERIAEAGRLSRIGRMVRASRLDEIPQLFNVLRGDMSMVGPRPLLPVDQPADPRVRLSVRPGVTGWAQVNGGVLLTPEEKDALDAWYVEHASLRFDLYILWRTAMYFFDGERRDSQLLASTMLTRLARRGSYTSADSEGGDSPRDAAYQS